MALDARGDLVRDTYDVYAVDDGVGWHVVAERSPTTAAERR